jgi:hypothetical protein
MYVRKRVMQTASIAALSILLVGSAILFSPNDPKAQVSPNDPKEQELATATSGTGFGTVLGLVAGPSLPRMLVKHSRPFVDANPACARPTPYPNHYKIMQDDPGRALFHAMLLSAFLNGREVYLGPFTRCDQGYPIIDRVEIR